MHHLSRSAVGGGGFCAAASAARARREPNYYLQRRDCKIALPLLSCPRPRSLARGAGGLERTLGRNLLKVILYLSSNVWGVDVVLFRCCIVPPSIHQSMHPWTVAVVHHECFSRSVASEGIDHETQSRRGGRKEWGRRRGDKEELTSFSNFGGAELRTEEDQGGEGVEGGRKGGGREPRKLANFI